MRKADMTETNPAGVPLCQSRIEAYADWAKCTWMAQGKRSRQSNEPKIEWRQTNNAGPHRSGRINLATI